jgi:hypothetical protein
MRTTSLATLIAASSFAFGCSSSPAAAPDDSTDTTDTGGAGGAGGAAATDAGKGGAKADGGKTGGGTGTGGKSGGSGGSTGTAGAPPGPLTYTDASAPMPPASWTNVTNNLAGLSSECGNAAAVYASPWYDMLVTGIATGGETQGLFASNDGGASWTKIGTGAGSTITYRMTVVLFDPEKPNTWWASGIYGWENPWCEGADITEDNGNSFLGYWDMGAQKQSHNDSISVDFTDPARLTMLSGGHEQESGGQGVFLSTDGSSFTDIGSSLPTGLGFCTNTLVVSQNNLLVGCNTGFKGGSGAIMRSTDVGATWTKVYATGIDGQPLLHSDGTIYWGNQGGGILKSTDKGVTWSLVADKSKANGRAIELPDKRIAAVANKIIVVSGDGGATWKNATTAIPFDGNGIAYNRFRKAFYTSHGDCTNTTPSDAYAGFGWDYTTN